MSWHLAFHTSIAFGTNTDYQHYVPEEQASLFASMFGLQLLMFTSPATGMCVFAAMARGFSRKDGRLGNYYSDFVRTITRVLVPITVIGALALVLLGVPETLTQAAHVLPLTGGHETIPLGPVASWDSIEFLGTNGGGFFSANAGNPFQNPTSGSNFVAILLMLSIPLASPFAFSRLVRRPGEAAPLFATILTIFLAGFILFLIFEGSNSFLPATVNQGSGYLVGAETRFSISENALIPIQLGLLEHWGDEHVARLPDPVYPVRAHVRDVHAIDPRRGRDRLRHPAHQRRARRLHGRPHGGAETPNTWGRRSACPRSSGRRRRSCRTRSRSSFPPPSADGPPGGA